MGACELMGGNSSGDIFMAFSTANPQPMAARAALTSNMIELNPDHLDPIYQAAVESVDEAVINAMVAGEDVATVRPRGKICRAIDTEMLAELFRGA